MFQLATALARDRQYRVTFVVGDFDQPAREVYADVEVYGSLKLEGSHRTIRYVSGVFKLMRLFQSLDPDVIVQRAAGKETGLAALYCRLFRKKFIYMTAHEIDCSGEFIRSRWPDGLIYRYGLTHADQVIAQSLGHQAMLRKNYGLDSQVLKSCYPLPVQCEKKEGGVILWVGRLDRWKQPQHFVSLARHFPDESFVMIAPAAKDVEYAASVRREAESLSNLDFIPGVGFQEINRYFEEAKIFINTSQYEGFPNTFVQAAMCGTPIVSLGVNPDDFLNQSGCGYCAEGDEDGMRSYVRKLLSDSRDWREKSQNAYRYASENHDIEKNILKLKEIINNVLDKN